MNAPLGSRFRASGTALAAFMPMRHRSAINLPSRSLCVQLPRGREVPALGMRQRQDGT